MKYSDIKPPSTVQSEIRNHSTKEHTAPDEAYVQTRPKKRSRNTNSHANMSLNISRKSVIDDEAFAKSRREINEMRRTRFRTGDTSTSTVGTITDDTDKDMDDTHDDNLRTNHNMVMDQFVLFGSEGGSYFTSTNSDQERLISALPRKSCSRICKECSNPLSAAISTSSYLSASLVTALSDTLPPIQDLNYEEPEVVVKKNAKDGKVSCSGDQHDFITDDDEDSKDSFDSCRTVKETAVKHRISKAELPQPRNHTICKKQSLPANCYLLYSQVHSKIVDLNIKAIVSALRVPEISDFHPPPPITDIFYIAEIFYEVSREVLDKRFTKAQMRIEYRARIDNTLRELDRANHEAPNQVSTYYQSRLQLRSWRRL